jgi:hypothetical protein
MAGRPALTRTNTIGLGEIPRSSTLDARVLVLIWQDADDGEFAGCWSPTPLTAARAWGATSSGSPSAGVG